MTNMQVRQRKFFVRLSFLAPLLISAFFASLDAKADEAGWVLTQRSKQFGDSYLYVSPTGLKMSNPTAGTGFIVDGQSGNMIFFNDKTRLYYAMSFEEGRRKFQTKERKPVHWKPGGTREIAGLRAKEFTVTSSAKGEMIAGDYWGAVDIKAPPHVAELLSAKFGTPTESQLIPLAFTYVDASGQSIKALETYRQQATNIPSNYYQAPNGYRLAKSEVDVMMTDEHRQIMNDIANDLGNTNSTSATSHIPAGGVTLPNGKTVSKDDVSRLVDAVRQAKQRQATTHP
jgi:hypothetical protein